jgi:hypothetical protein
MSLDTSENLFPDYDPGKYVHELDWQSVYAVALDQARRSCWFIGQLSDGSYLRAKYANGFGHYGLLEIKPINTRADMFNLINWFASKPNWKIYTSFSDFAQALNINDSDARHMYRTVKYQITPTASGRLKIVQLLPTAPFESLGEPIYQVTIEHTNGMNDSYSTVLHQDLASVC